MKHTLVELLLGTPSGGEIRDALGLTREQTFTEVLYLRFSHLSEQESHCEACARLAKWADDGTLSEKAADVIFRCLGIRGLHYSCDENLSAFEGIQPPIEIETGDRFWIFCDRIEVETIRPVNLSCEAR